MPMYRLSAGNYIFLHTHQGAKSYSVGGAADVASTWYGPMYTPTVPHATSVKEASSALVLEPIAGGDATASPATVAAVASVPSPTVQATALTAPSTVVVVAAVPAPSIRTTAIGTPSTVVAVASVPGPTVLAAALTAPVTVVAVVVVPTPTIVIVEPVIMPELVMARARLEMVR